jgi:hypothetical protein
MRSIRFLFAIVVAPCAFGQSVGPFQNVDESSTGGAATSLSCGDWDGDGRKDVVFSDITGLRIALSNPNATPRPTVLLSVPGGGVVGALADLFGDGSVDLVARGANGLTVRLGATTTTPGVPPPVGVALAPLVGSSSVVGTAASGGFPAGTARVVHVLRTGSTGVPDLSTFDVGGTQTVPTLTLRAGTSPAPPGGASDVAVGNFNGDGRADVIVVGAALSSMYALFLDLGGPLVPNPPQPVITPGGLLSSVPLVGDFNGDGLDDFLAGGLTPVAVVLNAGVGATGPTFTSSLVAGTSGFSPFGVGDYDGDGDLDAACRAGGGVRFLLNNGAGSFTLDPVGAPFGALFSGLRVASGDLDSDGDGDFASSAIVPGSPIAFTTHINETNPAVVVRPGTADGLGLATQLLPPGLAPPVTNWAFGPLSDIRRAPTGNFDLWFGMSAPPAFAGAPCILAVDVFITGIQPAPFLPSVYLSAAFAPLLMSVVPPAGAPILFGPLPLFPIPSGVSGLAQFAVVSPAAANGLYAISDAFELQW